MPPLETDIDEEEEEGQFEDIHLSGEPEYLQGVYKETIGPG